MSDPSSLNANFTHPSGGASPDGEQFLQQPTVQPTGDGGATSGAAGHVQLNPQPEPPGVTAETAAPHLMAGTDAGGYELNPQPEPPGGNQPPGPPVKKPFPGGLLGVLGLGLILALLVGTTALSFINATSHSAIVRFVRAKQDIPAPNLRVLVATNGTGQIMGTTQTASVINVASPPLDAALVPASAVSFVLTVTNGNRSDQSSPAGFQLTSATHQYLCTTHAAVDVPAFGSARQLCDVAAGPVQADSWSLQERASPYLDYSGRNPAGGSSALFVVPNSCSTDTTAAKAAAQVQLTHLLANQTPPGAQVFFGPTFTFDSVASCSPARGTQHAAPFTYVSQIGGNGTQASYTPTDAQTYQTHQLMQAAAGLGGTWMVLSSSVCPGGATTIPGTATPTSVSVQCAATGVAAWKWDKAALDTLATSIRGMSDGQAKTTLNATPGIASGSLTINLPDSATLPTDPTQISFGVLDA